MKIWHVVSYEFDRREIVRMVLYSCVTCIVISASEMGWLEYQAHRPPIRLIALPGEVAEVNGLAVTVQVHLDRNRISCMDGHADRYFAFFKNGTSPDTDDYEAIQWIRENRIAPTKKGRHDFTMRVTLSMPLTPMAGGAWFYKVRNYNGCSWIARMFGGETPVFSPALPARFVN